MKLFKGISVSLHVKSDEDWMILLKQNHREAFDALYEKYKRPIMSFIFSMTQNADLTEDLTQETFLKLFRARESYEASAKFSTFLWTIAKHTTFDHLSRKKEQLTLTDEPLEAADETPAADELLIQNLDETRVRTCLERLNPRAREIVNLRIFSEESYASIASITQNTEATVKTILHRSRLNLTECFKRGHE